MRLKRRINSYMRWTRNQSVLAGMVCVSLLVLALPWPEIFTVERDYELLGIPVLFMVAFLILPIAGGFLLSLFLDIAEDNDRHDQRFENE